MAVLETGTTVDQAVQVALNLAGPDPAVLKAVLSHECDKTPCTTVRKLVEAQNTERERNLLLTASAGGAPPPQPAERQTEKNEQTKTKSAAVEPQLHLSPRGGDRLSPGSPARGATQPTAATPGQQAANRLNALLNIADKDETPPTGSPMKKAKTATNAREPDARTCAAAQPAKTLKLKYERPHSDRCEAPRTHPLACLGPAH